MPATVEMTPRGETLRTTLRPASAMYRLPLASSATAAATPREALVAAPPSPGVPTRLPPPATVVIVYPCPRQAAGMRTSAANAIRLAAPDERLRRRPANAARRVGRRMG